MITKDISLEDCILDLIDNCLDGARKAKHSATAGAAVGDYGGFRAAVEFDANRFQIADNCGGINISEAIDYAFHFGRRLDAPVEGDYSIGLYGIGMKRAIFKMGNKIDIYSSTQDEAFRTDIDVKEWLSRSPINVGNETKEDWDFDMDDAPVDKETGTTIKIAELYSSISTQFANPEFANGLARIVARDYAQFLTKGFDIAINGRKIDGFAFTVRESAEFKSIRENYVDEAGVEVEIIAGMAGSPPDDLQPTERRAETDYYGWFVICNDRIVVASDKTDKTVWGDGDFQSWHYQYNGFIGVISFSSKDPNLLPWTTTKRDVDASNAAYRRAIEKMKDATRSWIKYTNDRKANLTVAKQHEAFAVARPLFQVSSNPKLQVPSVAALPQSISFSSIQYQKPTSEIAKAKKMLGNSRMPNYQVGEMTFDYYVKNESED
jgi:hypothetical protein